MLIRSVHDLERAGASLPGDCGNPTDKYPAWLLMEKFRRGQQFFRRHILSFMLMFHFSLVVGFSLMNLLTPLVFSGQSDTPEKAFKRYTDTFRYIALWHFGDVWEAPLGKAHQAVLEVRKIHNAVAAAMKKAEPKKTHVSQYDMCIVQTGFVWPVLMYPERFGIRCSREELDDYAHFWRGIGYLLGISDDHNLCSHGYDKTVRLVKEIEQERLVPAAVKEVPHGFPNVCDNYISGLNTKILPVFSKESVFAIFNEVVGLPLPKLGFADRLQILNFNLITFLIRWCPGFEIVCNILLTFAVNRELELFKKDMHEK